MPRNVQQMHVKLQKESFKKQQKQPVIWFVIKFPGKLRKFQTIHNKIIQRQLQMSMIKKYLKEGIFPEKRQEITDKLRLK